MRCSRYFLALWFVSAANALGQSAEAEARTRMRAALEAQATLPTELPRLPSEVLLPQAATPESATTRNATHRADQEAKSQGQSSLSKAKAEALRRAEIDVDGPGNSAAGMARSNAAKEKAKHVHKPPNHP